MGVPVGATKKRKVASPLDKAKGYEIVWAQVAPLFEAARGYGQMSYVYVIGEEDGPLKIGTAKDPIARLRGLQTGNPRRLRVEYVLVGDAHIEKLLHEMWESFAIFSSRHTGNSDAAPGTEWFKPEIREKLLPIVKTAITAQIDRLAQGGNITSAEMETIIREAHGAHDFVAHKRDEVVLLAQGAGYVIASRPSRI
jgi:hypothetical protein